MVWWQLYLLIFAAAVALAAVLTPVCEKIATRLHFLDCPDANTHNRHSAPIPVLGGVAMFMAWAATLGLGMVSVILLRFPELSVEVSEYRERIGLASGRLGFLCLGALVAMLTGFVDDYFKLSAKVKFSGQLLAAGIAVFAGGMRVSLFLPYEPLIVVVSILWILVIINAINFLDNMDGLAVGIAVIAMLLLTSVAIISKQYFFAALGAAGAGTGLGFWFFNRTPASIFMGDSGSHFLGYMLAVLSAGITYHMPDVSTTRMTSLIPLFILAIPLFDTLTVVLIRLYYRKPVYIGDHNHISHRFVKMGMSRKHAVMAVHLLTLAVGVGVLPVMWGDEMTAAIIVAQSTTFLVVITMLQFSGGYDSGNMR